MKSLRRASVRRFTCHLRPLTKRHLLLLATVLVLVLAPVVLQSGRSRVSTPVNLDAKSDQFENQAGIADDVWLAIETSAKGHVFFDVLTDDFRAVTTNGSFLSVYFCGSPSLPDGLAADWGDVPARSFVPLPNSPGQIEAMRIKGHFRLLVGQSAGALEIRKQTNYLGPLVSLASGFSAPPGRSVLVLSAFNPSSVPGGLDASVDTLEPVAVEMEATYSVGQARQTTPATSQVLQSTPFSYGTPQACYTVFMKGSVGELRPGDLRKDLRSPVGPVAFDSSPKSTGYLEAWASASIVGSLTTDGLRRITVHGTRGTLDVGQKSYSIGPTTRLTMKAQDKDGLILFYDMTGDRLSVLGDAISVELNGREVVPRGIERYIAADSRYWGTFLVTTVMTVFITYWITTRLLRRET